jgi:Resolvase, N terminal domain.
MLLLSNAAPGIAYLTISVAASERPGFTRLLDRMENGDVLIVTKLDRPGRNAIDLGCR